MANLPILYCPNLDFDSGKACELSPGHEGPCSYARVQQPPSPAAARRAGVFELEFLLDCAERIIVFAVARLDVLTFPGWPYEDLRKIALHYKGLRGDQGVDPQTGSTTFDPETQRKRELGQIWLDFVAEAESWEESRRLGTHKQRLQQENLMRAPAALLKHTVPEQKVTVGKKRVQKGPVKTRKGPKKPKK